MQIEDIKKLNLDPGDIVVVRVSKVLSDKQRELMYECLDGVLGKDARAMILDGGVSIDVLSKKKAIDERNIASEAADEE